MDNAHFENLASTGGVVAAELGMLRAIIRILLPVVFGSLLVLITLALAAPVRATDASMSMAERVRAAGLWSPAFFLKGALLVGVALLLALALSYLLKRCHSFLDADALLQARFLDTSDPRYVDLAIVVSAALSLFLELAVIRWQSSVLPFLAFYKNFSLLACFAGLGLGYALANRSRIPLLLVLPLLTWQIVFMTLTRTVPGLFFVMPFREQLSMGVGTGDWLRVALLYLLLTVVFLITALTFIPVGMLCGRLMERRTKLRAYGLNLIGSLLGVLMMLATSSLWTPPLVWFALCFLVLVLFHVRRPASLFTGIAFALAATIALAWWPVDRLWNRVYSPYQLLEIGTDDKTGLTLIRAAGHYYQAIYDLSGQTLSPGLRHIRDYYDLPYKFQPSLNDVAVVGSGTGSDVAAALRAGAKRVDAIEIDPAILLTAR